MYLIAAALYMISASCFVIAYTISKDARWGLPAALMMLLSIWQLILGGLHHG